MRLEFEAFIKNATWLLVAPLDGKNAIGCKWIFRVKLKIYRTLDKYKARLMEK